MFTHYTPCIELVIHVSTPYSMHIPYCTPLVHVSTLHYTTYLELQTTCISTVCHVTIPCNACNYPVLHAYTTVLCIYSVISLSASILLYLIFHVYSHTPCIYLYSMYPIRLYHLIHVYTNALHISTLYHIYISSTPCMYYRTYESTQCPVYLARCKKYIISYSVCHYIFILQHVLNLFLSSSLYLYNNFIFDVHRILIIHVFAIYIDLNVINLYIMIM